LHCPALTPIIDEPVLPPNSFAVLYTQFFNPGVEILSLAFSFFSSTQGMAVLGPAPGFPSFLFRFTRATIHQLPSFYVFLAESPPSTCPGPPTLFISRGLETRILAFFRAAPSGCPTIPAVFDFPRIKVGRGLQVPLPPVILRATTRILFPLSLRRRHFFSSSSVLPNPR